MLAERNRSVEEARKSGRQDEIKAALSRGKDEIRRLMSSMATAAEINQAHKTTDKRVFWNFVRQRLSPERDQPVSDENVDEWAEHFSKLFNPDPDNKNEQVSQECRMYVERDHVEGSQHAMLLNRGISENEVESAIASLSNGKAPGPDGIYNDMVKKGGAPAVKLLGMLYKCIWKSGVVPRRLFTGMIVPLPKPKRDKDAPPMSNFSPITLTSAIGKTLERILHARLTRHVRAVEGLEEEQFGFQEYRSTAHATFTLCQMVAQRQGESTYVGFLDISKAYDTVWRDGLWSKMREIGVGGEMLGVLKGMYADVSAFVKGVGRPSEEFAIANGVRQGSVLSPLLYNVFINGLIRELRSNACVGVEVQGNRVPCCLFADDIALVATSAENMRTALKVASDYADKWRFKFGSDKSKVVVFSRRKNDHSEAPRTWALGNTVIETVASYKYLGTWLSEDMRWKLEAQNVTAMVRKKMGMLWGSGLLHRNLSMESRKTMIETMILPTLTYGAEVVAFAGPTSGAKTAWNALKRRWLHCARTVTGTNWAAEEHDLLGLLGWKPLDFYRDRALLNFFGKLARSPEESLDRGVFETAMVVGEQAFGSTFNWANSTAALLEQYDIKPSEAENLSREEWRSYVQVKLADFYNELWKKNADSFSCRRVPFFDPILDTLSPNQRRLFVRLQLRRPVYKKSLFDLGWVGSAQCSLCRHDDETEIHVLCYCPVV